MRQKSIIAVASAAAAAFVFAGHANAAEQCFNKATLSYEDCPKPPAPPPALAPAPVAAAAPTPWTGPYVGLHAGYVWAGADVDGAAADVLEDPESFLSDDDIDDLDDILFDAFGFETDEAVFSLSDDEFDIEGFLVGGQLGYMHQFKNNIVLGGEIDGSWAWADDSIEYSIVEDNDPDNGGSIDLEGELDYLASARVRVGYAFDRVMPYATGGVAISGWEFSVLGEEEDVTAFGGVLGGGVEALIGDNFLVGAEGLYYIFDEGEDFGLGEDIVEIDDAVVARVRASYKF
ncbi:MAG: outer membrane beta-barrel protein [Pseudomonadota bacterium]